MLTGAEARRILLNLAFALMVIDESIKMSVGGFTLSTFHQWPALLRYEADK